MSIPVMNTVEFRQKVAGLIDPNRKPTGLGERASIAEEAKTLCLVMCELFGGTLKRETLWDRITSALITASAKCDDGDTDRFAALCLEHIKAEPSQTCRNERFANWVYTMSTRDDAYRQEFVRHCALKHSIVTVYAKRDWAEYKKMNPIGTLVSAPEEPKGGE